MTPDTDTSESRPHWLELVVAYRLFIGVFLSIGLLGAIGYVWLNGFPKIVIGQNAKVAAFALFLSVPTGALIARPIVSWLYSTTDRWLVVLGLSDNAGIWRLPPADWSDLEVTKGQLHQFEVTKEPMYCAVEFDRDELEATGTWRGTLSDRDLLRALSKVDECRGQLEDDAKRGFAIETQAFTIVRSATREAVRSVIDTFEDGTLPDHGDGLDAAISEAIEQYDLETEIESNLDDDADARDVAEQVGDDLPDDFQEAPADE
ncbi:hypothetical protein [Halorhabdus salina]|uniref:hypothetical protein n=1 Tax=Halorhabdus salina TaxID=2750670 RepID=UPI0015EF8EA8|nr:hypothetical protein [Halorhabdus salina]